MFVGRMAVIVGVKVGVRVSGSAVNLMAQGTVRFTLALMSR
jgi:hypothetical protein